ncbi:MAG: peptide chain release factor N(5)-glutamine methyltransferase [Candidatus Peregrinibacteria bacterium]|nr:peptide chain release factor N(5)-glutamine methyltransferase [Candidatus Peregrinibacteria bacterium]
MTIRDLIKRGYEFLEGAESAVLNCEVVLANVLGVEKEYLIAHSEEEVEEGLADLFMAYLKKVKSGEPVAYILKEKDFYGLSFFVDNRVLVPRPETEQLVETVLSFLEEKYGVKRSREFESDAEKFRILDVGTGSGNIAISLATNFQNLEAVALDVSDDAIEVARVNVNQHGVEDRVELYQSDLLDAIEDGENFHVIVANLPYIGTKTNSDVDENVEKHEPASALFAGEDGLDLYLKMFKQIQEKNVSYDLIVGEFGSMQREDMEALLTDFFGQNWRIEKDLAGLDRMFVVEYKS